MQWLGRLETRTVLAGTVGAAVLALLMLTGVAMRGLNVLNVVLLVVFGGLTGVLAREAMSRASKSEGQEIPARPSRGGLAEGLQRSALLAAAPRRDTPGGPVGLEPLFGSTPVSREQLLALATAARPHIQGSVDKFEVLLEPMQLSTGKWIYRSKIECDPSVQVTPTATPELRGAVESVAESCRQKGKLLRARIYASVEGDQIQTVGIDLS